MPSARKNLTIDARVLELVEREAAAAGVSVSSWVTEALRDAAVRSDAERLGAWVSRHAELHDAWLAEAERESPLARASQGVV